MPEPTGRAVPPAGGRAATGRVPGGAGHPAARREFAVTLLLGAAGAGLALLAVRESWARAVYQAPHPLPPQSVTLSGQDLVPAVGALALAGLACLAAVIATRGILRRAAGVVLLFCGVGTAVALRGSLTTSGVLAAAAANASSSSSVASGGAGSTTGSSTTVGGAIVTGGSSAHAVLVGVPWRAAVLAGALACVAAGLLTAWRGTRWPVMSARYERPGASGTTAYGAAGSGLTTRTTGGGASAGPSGDDAGPSGDDAGPSGDDAGPSAAGAPPPVAPVAPVAPDPADLDPAALWDSISRGDDPTELAGGAPGGRRAG